MLENGSLAPAKQTVPELGENRQDGYVVQEESFQGEGLQGPGGYSPDVDPLLDDIETQIESAQEMSDLWETQQEGLGVADDSGEFMTPQMDS